MADKKISQLTAATTPLDGTEVLPIVQSSSTVKVTNNALRPKQIQSNTTSGILQVTGPAAASTCVMTTPNANFTVARTDDGQSFSGNQSLLDGNLVIGTSGKGIDFSATASGSGTMTSELLSDYEEGTWTPTPKFGGGNTGMTYTSTGFYTKVGNQVTVWGTVSISSNGSSTGSMTIEGLPYSIAGYSTGSLIGDGFTFTGAQLAVFAANGLSVLYAVNQLGGTGSSAGYAYLTQAAIGVGGKYFSITYRTS